MSDVNIVHGELGDEFEVRLEQPLLQDAEFIPAAVIVQHERAAVDVMIGRSPIDGSLVVHIDGNVGHACLGRVYLNDQLIVGDES